MVRNLILCMNLILMIVTAWTGSADGTGHRHVEHLSHYMYITKMANDSSSPPTRTLLNLGVRAATGKTSEIQLEVAKTMLAEYLEIYNESPLGNEHPLALDNVLRKLVGWGSDHAEDQKKFFRLLSEWKQHVDREQRGSASLKTLMEENAPEYVAHVMRATESVIAAAGGPVAWDVLAKSKQEEYHAQAMTQICVAIGQDVFDALSDVECANIDLMVWAGCAMHKEQNTVKGGGSCTEGVLEGGRLHRSLSPHES